MSEGDCVETSNTLHCPQCKREYRAAATECSDCHGALVPGTVPAPASDATVHGSGERRQRVSVTGLIIGGLMILFSFAADSPTNFMQFVSGVALIVRSCFPPMGFLRGFAVWVGGAFVGMALAYVPAVWSPSPFRGIAVTEAVISIVFGTVLLIAGFTKPRERKRQSEG
ncbi:MAG: hypothetical protein JSV65_05920 [Armatimonadota bacterium]|nr:MAG: hypothetical protein JSV65_05920 [Armatimonadota bacterium]